MHYKITNGAVCFGAVSVLENVNIEIKDGEKIAVVGRNGAGKTTLLNCISGEIRMESGTGENPFCIEKSGNPEIGFLKQINFQNENATLSEEVLSVFKPLTDIENETENLLIKMQTETSEQTIKRYSALQDKYQLLGGYTYKKEYSVMLKKFGFTEEDKRKKICEFSGGQRTKIAFMKLLLSHPDVLLLDEPTNHLDVSATKWLESYLRAYKSAVVTVSHDRQFIENTCSKIYEIEYGETKCYKGNYSSFVRQKRADYEKSVKDYEYQQAEIARLTKLVERFRYKPTKASMAQSKLKQIERMRKLTRPEGYDLKTFKAHFQPKTESAGKAFFAKDLCVGYDKEKPLAKVTFELKRGQKLGVIGNNGTGKSTFVKTLTGETEKLSGEFCFGLKTEIGYFNQQMAQRISEQTVLEDFRDEFPFLTDEQIRTSLGAFNFSGEEVFKKISELSGGERVRLGLCKIFKKQPDFLILDEPTNHIDVVHKETLEEMLCEYSGTVIIVSHDRYLINKVADRLLVFENGGANFYPITYAEYEEAERVKENQAEHPELAEKPTVACKENKRGFTTPLKEKSKIERKLKKTEEQIGLLEQETASLQKLLENPEIYSDFVKLTKIQTELEEKTSLIEKLTEEWLSLSERLSS